MYIALTVTLIVLVGAAWLLYVAVARWNLRRWMYGEHHGTFEQRVAQKRELLYKQLQTRRPGRWTPTPFACTPGPSFTVAYQDAVERLRLENDIAKCQRIIDKSRFVQDSVADRIIAAQDQLDEFMKRWRHGLMIPKSFIVNPSLL